jgi:hypothetical protein
MNPLFRPRSIHFCQTIQNQSLDTVPLNAVVIKNRNALICTESSSHVNLEVVEVEVENEVEVVVR